MTNSVSGDRPRAASGKVAGAQHKMGLQQQQEAMTDIGTVNLMNAR